jgi:hypothetical protein
VVVACFEALSQNLTKETEENHKGNSQSPVQESNSVPSKYEKEFVSM